MCMPASGLHRMRAIMHATLHSRLHVNETHDYHNPSIIPCLSLSLALAMTLTQRWL